MLVHSNSTIPGVQPTIIASSPFRGEHGRGHHGRLIGRLQDMSDQFRRTDRDLEYNERHRVRPGANWSGWFSGAAADLNDARHQFIGAVGRYDRTGDRIARGMANEVDNLYRNSDKVHKMYRYGDSFGRGWGRVLDNSIEVINDAIRHLRRSSSY